MSTSPRTPLTTVAAAVGAAFRRHEFHADAVAAHLGPAAADAVHRGEPAAVRAATRDGSVFSRLIRFFLLRDPASVEEVDELCGSGVAAGLLEARAALAEPDPGRLRMVMDMRPHVIAGAHRLVISDADAAMTEHVPDAEHVLGVGAASVSLLQSTPTTPVESVLDLGTGSGVQALGQLECADAVTATDVHGPALDLAEATFAANDAAERVELLQGPWFEPVAGRRFDRIVANPPFVVGLPEVGHVYRDSGLNLDEASELVVSQAAEHLTEGGTAHLLAAWIHPAGGSWRNRVASWLPATGVDAWVIQRDVADPELYVGTWLRDESIDPRSAEAAERTEAWLDHFAAQDVAGVGYGFVALRHIGDAPSEVLVEEMPQAFTDPLGPEVEEYFVRTAWLREHGRDGVAAGRFALRPGVAKETVAVTDDETGMGFKDVVVRLTRTDGPRWSHEIDEALAAIVAGLHPDGLDLGEVVGMYAAARGLDETSANQLHSEAITAVVDLIRHGLVVPADVLDREE